MNQKCGVMTMKFRSKTGDKIKTNFAKIVVSGLFDGKPYYEIMWFCKETNELNFGYGSYFIKYVIQWFRDCFEVVEDDAVEGMCCDCAHGGPCCSPDENTNCADRKEDGTCWVPYKKETTMQCYRDGGCGPYEGLSCTECPASKPDYKQRHKTKTDKHKIKTVPGHEPLTTAQQKDMAEFIDSNVILFPSLAKKEEANMDKPRICEVLGVEVREEFDFCMFSGLYVDEAGYVRLNEGAIIESTILCLLINEPDSIIRKPRFTQQEVERAKNLLEVVGNGELKQVGDMTTLRVDGKIIYLRKGAFPSMKPEQAINLDEIIGGAQ